MAKPKSVYACAECGATALQWFGTCPSCGAAGTLSESYAERGAKRIATPSVALADIEARELARLPTGIGELDRVLGAGLVAGQVVLLGGDPGIGKSTLLLQTLATLKEVLYVTGEESAEQIAMRARRLSLDAGGVRLLAETQLERILGALDAGKPAVAVIDSIQTLWSEMLQSAPGSVAQVRECAAQLTRHAKRAGTALFIIGHVTKEGAIAGPRVLEHIVDTVLYFEGDPHSSFRLIRAVKNRFGAVPVAASARRAGLVRSRHGGGHAAAAGRDPGARRRRPRAEPAPAFGGARAEPPRDAARRAAPSRRHRDLGAGRVRQRRRRRAHRRAGGRSRGEPRGRVFALRPGDPGEGRGVRRDRP